MGGSAISCLFKNFDKKLEFGTSLALRQVPAVV